MGSLQGPHEESEDEDLEGDDNGLEEEDENEEDEEQQEDDDEEFWSWFVILGVYC